MRTLKQLLADPDLAQKYADAFGEEPELLDVACLCCFCVVFFSLLHLVEAVLLVQSQVQLHPSTL